MTGNWEKPLEILQEISSALVVSDNIHTIAHLMLELAIRHTEAEKGSLMVRNDRDELYILSGRGVDERFLRQYRVKLGEGIAGTVALQGEPVLVADIAADPRFRDSRRDRYRTRSFISCPLKGKSGVLGVLNINDKKDGSPFTAEEFSLIRIIANQAAVALKNAFLVEKLKAQAMELEEVNRKLTDSDLAKTEFLTRISHELRTPLNAIKGAVYYLSHSPDVPPAERSEFLQIVDAEAEKLIAFSEKQLDFLRLEDETRITENRILKLEKVLKETLDSRLLQKSLKERRLQLRLDLPRGLPDLVGDRILLGQLFINLLEGICLHLEEGSVITLGARESEGIEIRLDVSTPLPPRILSCFEGRRASSEQRFGECIKIYLALKNADAHGWPFTAENGEGGFRFAFFVPRNSRQKVNAAIDSTMDLLLEFTSDLLGVNTCSLMLADDLTGDLAIRAARGLDDDIIRRTRIKFGDRIAGWVAHEGKPLLVEDIETDPRFGRRNLERQYASKSLMSLPLWAGGKVVGVINLNNRKDGDPFTPRDLRLARVVGERISAFLENLRTQARSDSDLAALVTSLNGLLQAEKNYPKKTPRLSDLMDRILEALGALEEERDLALYVGMVYDLGLMPIEKSVLGKKGRLSPAEVNTLRSHPFTTIDLLGDVEFSDQVRRTILHHHEKFDGTGYPDGLRGEDIPRLSRVLAVVDAFCAMTEERPYRKGIDPAAALEEIHRGSGTAFDPQVVGILSSLV